MTDLTKLKELAEQLSGYHDAASEGMKWLIAEVERLQSNAKNDSDLLEASSGIMTQYRIENERLKAENEALRNFAAEAYQVLGALDAPENVLDNASDAANGVPLRHKTLLPFFSDGHEALRKDAGRYQWLREQPNDCRVPRIDVVRWEPMDESANEGEGLRLEVLDAAIDAALEGGGR